VIRLAVGIAVLLAATPVSAEPAKPLVLDHGWRIQASARVGAGGEKISTRAFAADRWYPVSVPSTILAGLVADQIYKDPGAGLNLRAIPGETYPIGRNFANLPMPPDSPFRTSWWYRVEFETPSFDKDDHLTLHLDGVNYRADVWLNGRRVAASTDVVGMFRTFEFDVTPFVTRGGANVLAIEVQAPEATDLAWTWVDWNPAPPDKNMGLWRPVWLSTSGRVTVRYTAVMSDVDASLAQARLTAVADVTNHSDTAAVATLKLRVSALPAASRPLTMNVTLPPREHRVVEFTPEAYPALRVSKPNVWWPAGMGASPVEQATIDVELGGRASDSETTTFGIRTITSTLTASGARLFSINGKRLLIRGAGWAPDLLLREDPAREAAELAYVRDMHLNTVRLEGKLEDDHFFDLADRMGILVMAGWSCCDQWEQWAKWTPEHHAVAEASLRDQIARLRAHPSLLVWLNGSDNPPPDDVERAYNAILTDLRWPNPVLSSATARATASGPTGVKMTGPYDWVPPVYWYEDTTRGGAFGFNTETSPGPAIPPIESLKRMLPSTHLWPIDDVWNFHAGGGRFTTITTYRNALAARYGDPTGVEDFARKSQLAAYEGERAMFEAYGRAKYTATGVIQWMLNNAWPSLIWHLYDFYLQPGGGYFGAKKANEPVHVQYSYDDRSIVIVNAGPRLTAVTVHARVLGLDSKVIFSRDVTTDAIADGVVRVLTLPSAVATSTTYFLALRLSNEQGDTMSANVYWLSAKPDVLDHAHGTGTMTPVTSYADFTDLASMPAASVTSALKIDRQGDAETAHVTLTNTTARIAFFLRLQITQGLKGDEVLPVIWEDNFVTLLPGESREVSATYSHAALGGRAPVLYVRGWNVR